MLPNGGPGVTNEEGDLYVARWTTSLEYQPETERERVLAEALVEAGAQGDLLRRMLRRSGYTETPGADALTKDAREALKQYNAMRTTEADRAEAQVAYVEEVSW
jgi:hypothetical protein